MRDFVTGKVKSYSRIMNDEKSLGKFQDYNYLSIGMSMLNAENYVKTKETATKKVLEAVDKAMSKIQKEIEELSKWNELIYGFEGELKK